MPFQKKRYPPNWDEIATRIKDRDGNTCIQCGCKAGEEGAHDDMGKWFTSEQIYAMDESARRFIWGDAIVPTRIPTLATAHLDHDETNWDVQDDRLATMCDVCHLRYDKSDNASRRKYGRYYKDQQLHFNFKNEV